VIELVNGIADAPLDTNLLSHMIVSLVRQGVLASVAVSLRPNYFLAMAVVRSALRPP
jgi:hypothetical protein